MSVPPFHGNISFHAQHSPMGAFFSFTCGHFGSRGGFGLQIGKPGNQNLYIGVKEGDRKSDAPLKCLPFFEGADADEAARFDVEKKAAVKKPGITSYRREEIKRHYGWATDKWVTPDFEFAIYTPFGELKNTDEMDSFLASDTTLPAIEAKLIVDNSRGTISKTAFFAIRFDRQGWRPINPSDIATGYEHREGYGFIGQVLPAKDRDGSTTPIPFARWSPELGLREDALHLLGNCPGLAVEVPPGEKRTMRLVLGCFLPDFETTGIEGQYRYTRRFRNLADVLHYSLAFGHSEQPARQLDDELTDSKLTPDQQFLIAHATRSYYGSTQLLDVGGQPFWVVNEGEYCMMNTLDLSVDQVFWELKQNPWVVRNLLDNFVRHYSYVDQHGLSFCHDMGVHNQFSPFGHSSYELPNLNAACFSYMTCEELCNWVLIAACYLKRTGDKEWYRANKHVLVACFDSLLSRRGPGEGGFINSDSSRCGKGGAEITTYDSLDHSLAQTRNNLYMAVKLWACWAAFHWIKYGGIDDSNDSAFSDASHELEHLPVELRKKMNEEGWFPAVFEKGNAGEHSRILPAIEGLMYGWYLGQDTDWPDAGGISSFGADETAWLVEDLKKHTLALLKDPQHRNLFEDGGIKLSSTSNNSWMSKIAIFQHVCRKVFKLDEDPAIREMFAKADAAHVKWMTEGESAYWACSDQFVSGVAKGSKYYPRIITTALWME